MKSQSDGKEQYEVKLQGDNNMPSCECHSWTWTLLPCKHMFALFQHFEDITWDSLPEQYRCSPFFNLDTSVTSFTKNFPVISLPDEEDNDDDIQCQYDDTDNGTSGSTVPENKHHRSALKTTAIKCREQLSLIQNSTYLCQNVESLNNLFELLKDARLFIDQNLYIDCGLTKEHQDGTKSQRKRKVDTCSINEEPSSKKTRNALKIAGKEKLPSGRVGMAAEKRRQPVRVLRKKTLDDNVIIDGHTSVPEERAEGICKELIVSI